MHVLEDAADAGPRVQLAPDAVSRVLVGGFTGFFCDAATAAVAQRIVWRYHNATLHAVNAPDSPNGQFYQQFSTANTSFLVIHNVSRDAADTVACFLLCHGGGDLCVLRQFHLQLQLRAQDVFAEPMRDVSTPRWGVSMTCSGRVDCSWTPPASHFTGKYYYYYVAAPYPDLLGYQVPGLFTGSVTFNVRVGARRR
ncbi:uncharacterized protein LOC129601258 [Paramacrobiotus metropolitanus]|uniref:uncharacterized protein LOC129601258 n=1 Tax=Paramacrobiotus metropolitanus TaxID=2943436 RepID=UPI002445BA75|nr:uncharacterized protein LOC129601258 [Paramacrobiotus metropolitanus]XP_055355991.1 uncharacterized protein LOC129601258 [Paramacrobiotus metropolitanus]